MAACPFFSRPAGHLAYRALMERCPGLGLGPDAADLRTFRDLALACA
jgi:hypothetical protein